MKTRHKCNIISELEFNGVKAGIGDSVVILYLDHNRIKEYMCTIQTIDVENNQFIAKAGTMKRYKPDGIIYGSRFDVDKVINMVPYKTGRRNYLVRFKIVAQSTIEDGPGYLNKLVNLYIDDGFDVSDAIVNKKFIANDNLGNTIPGRDGSEVELTLSTFILSCDDPKEYMASIMRPLIYFTFDKSLGGYYDENTINYINYINQTYLPIDSKQIIVFDRVDDVCISNHYLFSIKVSVQSVTKNAELYFNNLREYISKYTNISVGDCTWSKKTDLINKFGIIEHRKDIVEVQLWITLETLLNPYYSMNIREYVEKVIEPAITAIVDNFAVDPLNRVALFDSYKDLYSEFNHVTILEAEFAKLGGKNVIWKKLK